jgi:hypothetical protein
MSAFCGASLVLRTAPSDQSIWSEKIKRIATAQISAIQETTIPRLSLLEGIYRSSPEL